MFKISEFSMQFLLIKRIFLCKDLGVIWTQKIAKPEKNLYYGNKRA